MEVVEVNLLYFLLTLNKYLYIQPYFQIFTHFTSLFHF